MVVMGNASGVVVRKRVRSATFNAASPHLRKMAAGPVVERQGDHRARKSAIVSGRR
jgi:hypothetical protein